MPHVPELQLALWTWLPTGQSPAVQQLALGMQVLPQTFWPNGQAQLPPGVAQTCELVQSELVQQAALAMQLPVPVQNFWPNGQAQLPPIPEHSWPEVHSLLSQHVPLATQMFTDEQKCGAEPGQTQAPPEPHSRPPPPQSALMQQLPAGMHTPPQMRCPSGQLHEPPAPGQLVPPLQSLLSQHVVCKMQLLDAVQVLKPERQEQLLPADAHTWPEMALQSVLVQHVPLGMHLPELAHRC